LFFMRFRTAIIERRLQQFKDRLNNLIGVLFV
jgi:hypothetical protein